LHIVDNDASPSSFGQRPDEAGNDSDNQKIGEDFMVSRHLGRLAIGASMVSAAFVPAAFAQQAPAPSPQDPEPQGPPDSGAKGDAAIPDIVITAQRRSERLDRVPIAASVIAGSDIGQRGITNLNDLAGQAPAFSIQNLGLQSYVNIRGVGLQATNPSTSSGVAVYSDGFFVAHETAIGDPYYDVERIEILRGPQGTLVGQSSTGGAMFVNSVRPSFEKVTGYLQATAGSYNSYRGEGALNLPASDRLAIRLAGHIDKKDSFSTNISQTTSSFQPGGYDGFSARIGVKWKPTDALDIYVKSEIGERHGDGLIGKPFGELDGTSLSSIGHPELRDPFTVSYNSPSFDKYRVWRTSAELNWNLSDSLTLRSLSGYQRQHSSYLFDQDFNDAASQTLTQDLREVTFEQELNLISHGTGPFNWVIGAFYLRDTYPVLLMNNVGPVIVNINAYPVEHSYAAFAQGTYDLTRRWQIQLGVRYNVNNKTLSGSSSTTIPAAPFLNSSGPLSGTAKSREPTGKIALNYFPDDNTTLYVSASRGFKAGGTNPVSPLVFRPEKINAYEAGVKARLLNRIRLTGAVFYYDYTDMQLSLLSSDPGAAAIGQAAITNAPKATVYGAEIEVNARLARLVLNGGIGYTHSKIDELTAADARNLAAGPQNLAGRPLAYAPAWTVNAGATYTVPLPVGALSARVQYSYTDRQFATPFQLVSASYSPLNGFAGVNDVAGARNLIDAHLTLRLNNGIAIEVFGTNLGDARYVAGTDLGTAIFGAPRQFGGRLTYSF
jgi:iron complex outermembrane receptor protein